LSKKHIETKAGEPDEDGMSVMPPADSPAPIPEPRIVQPMIDELVKKSPPEIPTGDVTPPPRGPLHPPQPAGHHHSPADQPEDPNDPGVV
jgi:hypothetical protein